MQVLIYKFNQKIGDGFQPLFPDNAPREIRRKWVGRRAFDRDGFT